MLAELTRKLCDPKFYGDNHAAAHAEALQILRNLKVFDEEVFTLIPRGDGTIRLRTAFWATHALDRSLTKEGKYKRVDCFGYILALHMSHSDNTPIRMNDGQSGEHK